jgi:hypothetical protein
MAERREDVEELLRLKTNPFPDGTLEAPEFPRRVYTTNIVQSVNAQLVAQGSKGARLLTADENGLLQVTIPQSARPYKYCDEFVWTTVIDWAPHQVRDAAYGFTQGLIVRIIGINFTAPLPSGATQGSTSLYLRSGLTGSNLIEVAWPYTTKPWIECSSPLGTGVVMYPGSGDVFLAQLHALRFDSRLAMDWYFSNDTDGTVSHTGFSLSVELFVEVY